MKRTVAMFALLCSLFITIIMLEFYRTAISRGNGERPHATSLTSNSVLNISRMALPAHVIPERMDLCSNRAPKNIFFDVGSNRGDVLHAFLYKNTYLIVTIPTGSLQRSTIQPHMTFMALRLFHHSLNH